MKTVNLCSISALLFVGLLFSQSALAVKPIYSGGKERAAIRGYDPVAYFTEGKAVKGDSYLSYQHQGAMWFFSNEQNRTAFSANPDKYTPQYGGYCAYAVANGATAAIKPKYFTIHEGKLYLNYSKSVQKKWLKDMEGFIKEADDEWPNLVD